MTVSAATDLLVAFQKFIPTLAAVKQKHIATIRNLAAVLCNNLNRKRKLQNHQEWKTQDHQGWTMPYQRGGNRGISKGGQYNDPIQQLNVPTDPTNNTPRWHAPNTTKHANANNHGGGQAGHPHQPPVTRAPWQSTDAPAATRPHARPSISRIDTRKSIPAPPPRKSTRTRTANGQHIGGKRNGSTTTSDKRIISLVKQHTALNRALLQQVGINDTLKEEVTVIESRFTYNFTNPKCSPASMITQDNNPPPARPSPPTKSRLTIMNASISPRTADIATVSLQQYMGSAFLKEMRQTLEIDDTLLDPEERQMT